MTALAIALRGRTFRSLRRHRNYRLFFTGQLISVAGTWMQNIALAWLVIQLSSSPLAVVLGEVSESVGEPGRPPRTDTTDRRPPFARQLEADPSSVVARADASDQAERLEPIDVGGERRRRDPFGLRKLAQGEPGPSLDQPQERCLVRRDAELLGLPP